LIKKGDGKMERLDYTKKTANAVELSGRASVGGIVINGHKKFDNRVKVLSSKKRKENFLGGKLAHNVTVTKLDPRDIKKAANIITDAFMDYPLPGQYVEDIGRRRIALQEMFKVELRKAFKKGSVYTLGEDFQEVAIWKHEVVPESDFAYIKYIRFSTLKLLFYMKPRECIRLFRALRNVSDTKLSLNLPANTAELYIVGVNPANQGQGRLSRLLKPVLNALKDQGRSALVMTNTKSNRKIYEHLGFKLVQVLDDKENECLSYYLVK
jgi:GNAT superfamily N-acetyltransferase